MQTLLILGALTAFGPLSIDMYLPALPRLARDFGDAPHAVQVTLTTCLAGLAFGQMAAGVGGVVPVLVPLFAVVASIGSILPNATALALELHPEATGTASGAIGAAQFAVAASAAPLVGAGGAATALPMALVIAACGTGALALLPRR